jgi:hypothetical protein
MERQGGHVGGIQGWIICDVVKEYYELPISSRNDFLADARGAEWDYTQALNTICLVSYTNKCNRVKHTVVQFFHRHQR